MQACPDFLCPQRRAPQLLWWALAAAAAVLLAAALDAHSAWQERSTARHALRASAPPAAARPARTTRAQAPPRQALAWQQWHAKLQTPWPAVFLASEQAAGAGLAWLALSHDARGVLQLEGLAEHADAALATAERLRRPTDGSPPIWQQVLVTQLAQAGPAAPEAASPNTVGGRVRFVLQASRSGPAEPQVRP